MGNGAALRRQCSRPSSTLQSSPPIASACGLLRRATAALSVNAGDLSTANFGYARCCAGAQRPRGAPLRQLWAGCFRCACCCAGNHAARWRPLTPRCRSSPPRRRGLRRPPLRGSPDRPGDVKLPDLVSATPAPMRVGRDRAQLHAGPGADEPLAEASSRIPLPTGLKAQEETKLRSWRSFHLLARGYPPSPRARTSMPADSPGVRRLSRTHPSDPRK